MDAFYVSVELQRHPELRGLPIVVGGTASRGVVSAASYEARRFGVFSAMPSSTAKKMCPHAVFLPPDMAHYLEVSHQLHDIFESFTPLVEQISVDEAFMDVTGAEKLLGSAVDIAWQLRTAVLEKTGLTCSVGVAPNKFLAKLASEHAKPVATADEVLPGHQVFVVEVGHELEFLHPLPIKSMWGVGPATSKKLDALGVRTVGDIAALDEVIIRRAVGEANGRHLHQLSLGLDDRDVEPIRTAKSIGNEETFVHDLTEHDDLRAQLVRLCDSVARRCRASDVAAGTMMLKVKFSSFETVTRSVTPSVPLTTGPSMVAALEPLLLSLDCFQGVRLLGVHAQKLTTESGGSARLFDDGAESLEDIEEQWIPASKAMDSIVDKFGEGVIGPASALDSRRPGESPFGPVED